MTDSPFPAPCWNERHDLMRDVAAAAWGYRVAYEAYWGENVPHADLPVDTKQRLLAALVGWQQELDAALAAMDDTPGDFEAAKKAHRETIARLIGATRIDDQINTPSLLLGGDFDYENGAGASDELRRLAAENSGSKIDVPVERTAEERAEYEAALARVEELRAKIEEAEGSVADDPRTADQKRRDADGCDYGDLSTACHAGHLHFCPECGKQHMHEGGEHPDCELRGMEHSWNRWETHMVDDRISLRFCDRCGAEERQRLDV